MTYPRSPKTLVGGLAHLGPLIDKIRLRHAGHIQDYNYLTVGFDKYLLEFLNVNGQELEQRVLQGGTDEEILCWITSRGRQFSADEIRTWNDRILAGGPKDEAARQRFQARLKDIATQRGVPVNLLPHVNTWADVIELDEGRL